VIVCQICSCEPDKSGWIVEAAELVSPHVNVCWLFQGPDTGHASSGTAEGTSECGTYTD
jgi:hypothetical protein